MRPLQEFASVRASSGRRSSRPTSHQSDRSVATESVLEVVWPGRGRPHGSREPSVSAIARSALLVLCGTARRDRVIEIRRRIRVPHASPR